MPWLRSRSPADFVGPGERLTAQHFQDHLPDSWVVICNREIVQPSLRTREIDFIVVGDHGVYVVEEKHWHGRILGNDKGWVFEGTGESRPSPLNSVASMTKHLAGLLKRDVPGLAADITGQHRAGIFVVLSDERCRARRE